MCCVVHSKLGTDSTVARGDAAADTKCRASAESEWRLEASAESELRSETDTLQSISYECTKSRCGAVAITDIYEGSIITA